MTFLACLMSLNRYSRMAAFRLNNPVDTFRNGIVGGFVVFRHTDGNAMFLKKCHVWSQQYCTPRSGVMYQVRKDFHLLSFPTACSIACCNALMVADTRKVSASTHPTILWGVGIRNQMQITDFTIGKWYIK